MEVQVKLPTARPDGSGEVKVELAGRTIVSVAAAEILTGSDPNLANTWESPDALTLELKYGGQACPHLRFGLSSPLKKCLSP